MSNGTATHTAPAMPQVRTTTALARHEAIEPQTMAELKDFAKIAADSQFFGASTPQQAMMIAMAGRDLGFSYTQSLRAFHVIKNKPSLSADGMVAACLQHRELCLFFRAVKQTATEATWETQRVGSAVQSFTFTIEDAKNAGLLEQNGGMWKKYPQRMLSARAKAFLARDVYPELLMGLYDPDELGEIPNNTAPPVHVEATVVESFHAPAGMSESEYSYILSAIETCTDDGELRKLGAQVANHADMSDEQRKALRGAYAKRKNKIAKLAREAEAAQDAADAQEIDGEVINAAHD